MLIGSGAEASIFLKDNVVCKRRIVKSYRHPDIDRRLRVFRTRREAKIMRSLSGLAPEVFSVDDVLCEIRMSFVSDSTLESVLNADSVEKYMEQLASIVSVMHSRGVVHNDLTTKNVLVSDSSLVLIDFGLSEFSSHVEHVAVDLHVLKESFAAKHPNLGCWELFWKCYNPSTELVERLSRVESRGRYKNK